MALRGASLLNSGSKIRPLYEPLEKHAARQTSAVSEQNYWSNKVRLLSSAMIMKGEKPNINEISKKLRVSRRGLQTKLKAEETSFRRCLETVRKQIALDYLDRDDVSICEVAFLLGYSEQSAFNHAFKRWTGKIPQACRRV
ncbi:MAG: AraC family transcriptional regulator [Proteobacteria bacterium]|nr:AraC family transcriptional regulator [Pseudomonadota bacterium]